MLGSVFLYIGMQDEASVFLIVALCEGIAVRETVGDRTLSCVGAVTDEYCSCGNGYSENSV